MEQGKLKGIDCFISFKKSVENIPLPKLFTFPFYYTPHPLCLIAVEEIKELIINGEWDHNFGLNSNSIDPPVGKMFGVLVVKNKQGQLGYLAGYSGKIGEVATVAPFVPPIFNRLAEDSYFKSEEMILNSYNAGLKTIEESVEFAQLLLLLDLETKEADKVIIALKEVYKKAKKSRRKNRDIAKSTMNEVDFENFQEKARKESLKQQHAIKKRAITEMKQSKKYERKLMFSQIKQLISNKKGKKNQPCFKNGYSININF